MKKSRGFPPALSISGILSGLLLLVLLSLTPLNWLRGYARWTERWGPDTELVCNESLSDAPAYVAESIQEESARLVDSPWITTITQHQGFFLVLVQGQSKASPPMAELWSLLYAQGRYNWEFVGAWRIYPE